jgi:hypothetical protein
MTYERVSMLLNHLNAELNPIRHLPALAGAHHFVDVSRIRVNPLNAELNPIRHLPALAGAHNFVDLCRIWVKNCLIINSCVSPNFDLL